MDFRFGAGPLSAVEGLHGEFDEELVSGDAALVGGFFEALPLLGTDADVLLDGLSHGRFFECLARFGAGIGGGLHANCGRTAADARLPVWYLS